MGRGHWAGESPVRSPEPGLTTPPTAGTGGSAISAGMKGQENGLGAEGVWEAGLNP